MTKISGGVGTKIIYSGSKPSFNHPIKSETLSSSKQSGDFNKSEDSLINDEMVEITP